MSTVPTNNDTQPRNVLVDSVSCPVKAGTTASEERTLTLLFLGCEAKPPYGPYDHTASLFLDLIKLAIHKQQHFNPTSVSKYNIVIQIYHVSQGNNLPSSTEIQKCDGIILPGSFNSAYDDEVWIHHLKNFIQTQVVAQEIPTLGVCFGHQIYAHSFVDGNVTKCPAGPQAGRKSSKLTKEGQEFILDSSIKNDPQLQELDLFCTHGDMVEKLPSIGKSLGGNDKVPIQAAIYYSPNPSDDNTTTTNSNNDNNKVIAVTFQAHPEYATSEDKGLEMTLHNIIEAMKERGDITDEESVHAKDDAIRQYHRVMEQSVGVMISAGQKLGWF
jgi:GMP synthase-like glutamine amidotransferase